MIGAVRRVEPLLIHEMSHMTSAQTPTAQLHMRIHGMRKSVQNIIYASKVPEKQALNFDLEGALQFSFGKGHFYEKSVNLYLNFAKGTTEKHRVPQQLLCVMQGLE